MASTTRGFADGLPHLVAALIRTDEGWPRLAYREVYLQVAFAFEWLDASGAWPARTHDILIEFADGLLELGADSDARQQVLDLLTPAFRRLAPRLLHWALDALELLRDLGMEAARTRPLLEHARSQQEVSGLPWSSAEASRWQALANWCGMDSTYSEQLWPVPSEFLDVDPIADMPQQLILILTLHPDRAARARASLLQRNPALSIEVRDDKANSKGLQSALKRADLLVYVYRASTHAVFYSLDETAKGKMIQPRNSGAPAIVACVEEFALSTHPAPL